LLSPLHRFMVSRFHTLMAAWFHGSWLHHFTIHLHGFNGFTALESHVFTVVMVSRFWSIAK